MAAPNVMICSVLHALRYLSEHIGGTLKAAYPENYRTYAVISIQDTPPEQFGFVFTESKYCQGVLTLYFDDIEAPWDGLRLMSEEQARQIIAFLDAHRDADDLLIHCRAGISRSAAVGIFARAFYGQPPISETGNYVPNQYVYRLLCETWEVMKRKTNHI